MNPILPSETWRRNQLAICVAAGLLFFGFTLAMPFLPYFIESLGVHGPRVQVWSGLVLFTAPFLAALMGPIWGRLTDRYGMKIMIQRIVIAMILHWLLMYFVDSIAHLMVLRVMLGVFSGFGTISVALITHGVPRERVGEVVGSLQSTQILSAAAGPAVGGVLFDHFGLRPTFLITAGICGLGFFLVTFAYREVQPGGAAAAPGGPAPISLRSILTRPGLLPLLGLLFFAALVDRSFGVVVPLVIQDLAPPGAALGTWSGLTISGGAFAGSISAVALGRIARRGRPRRLTQLSLLGGAVLLAGMAAAGSATGFAALRVGYGLAAGGLLTLGYTVAAELVGETGRATSYGFLSGGAMMGGALGPLLAGVAAPWIGFRGFLLAAAVVSMLLAFLARGDVRRERDRATEAGPMGPYIPLPR